MRIAIVGSRKIHRNTLQFILPRIVEQLDGGHTLVSGGANGVDAMAEGLARGMGNPVLIFKPEWDKHGKAAGFKRNQKIVDAADKILAFSFGTPGTLDTIERAKASGKPLTVYHFSPETGLLIGVEPPVEEPTNV